MSAPVGTATRVGGKARLPWGGLLALFAAGFLGIINETIPAGLLPQISDTLGLPESTTGQTVTVYALASALTAIPLNSWMRRWGRRTVVIVALSSFILANVACALIDNFAIILIARFVAGMGAGLVWSNIGGFAARLVKPEFRGRAVTIAMAGTPVALSLGLPAGTILGTTVGWQATFGAVAVVSAVLVVWALVALPNVKGQVAGEHVSIGRILRARGVRSILIVLAGFVVAHNILYTYISPLAVAAGIGDEIQWVLFTFGIAALVSIWITGVWVDRRHRPLIVGSMIIVGIAALTLGFSLLSPIALYVGAAAWGLGFGGATTLFVTAATRAAGTDGVQAIVVTIFNLGIAAGGLLGGILLGTLGFHFAVADDSHGVAQVTEAGSSGLLALPYLALELLGLGLRGLAAAALDLA